MAGDGTASARPEPAGIHRRALIKRAAAAGAVAWTAPMILESMVSPAGAVTGGCQRIHIVVPNADPLACEALPASSSAWTATCDGSVGVGTCGALRTIPVTGATAARL